MQDIDSAVSNAIAMMHRAPAEPVTVDDMARAAMFSKFHFSRSFQKITGISPCRFLAAIRTAEAKRLLLQTPMNVASISNGVGYTSIGTFSTRFKWSVGTSPVAYRRHDGMVPIRFLSPQTITSYGGEIIGSVSAAFIQRHDHVFVGLFRGKIVENEPASYAVLDHPGPFLLRNIPPGRWHLVALGLGPDREPIQMGYQGPITVYSSPMTVADIRLREIGPLDPPVLSLLPAAALAGNVAHRAARPSPAQSISS